MLISTKTFSKLTHNCSSQFLYFESYRKHLKANEHANFYWILKSGSFSLSLAGKMVFLDFWVKIVFLETYMIAKSTWDYSW